MTCTPRRWWDGTARSTGSACPRFDSAACFAELLGNEDHGSWKLAPKGSHGATHRHYRGETLVLESEFVGEEGTVRIIDCMPIRERHPEVVRLVEGVRGKVTMEMVLTIRFGYGQIVPWVRRIDGTLNAIAGPDGLSLWTPVETHGRDLSTVAEFTVSEGQRIPFSLSWYPASEVPPRPVDAVFAIQDTELWWNEWVSQCTYEGDHREAVVRSLITLKALTYEPTGGIVAAATTSLPETLGGNRNWDYRFCWLRDATLTLESLMRGGFYQEAMAWRNWLLRATAGDPSQMQIMYGAAGERRLDEWEVDWLPGYEGSAPVRIGNAAAGQFQLDVYGEVMSALYESEPGGEQGENPAWQFQLALMDFLRDGWREPDDGIWEVRGPRRHFTHSKVMAWVAIDRAIKTAEEYGMQAPLDRVEGGPQGDPRAGLRRGLQPVLGLVHPVLRLRSARRQPVDDPADGIPSRPRPAGSGDHRSHRARPGRGGIRPAVPHRRHRRGRRAFRSGGGLPGLLVLAGGLSDDARAGPRRPPAPRPADGSAQRPGTPVRGVRPGGREAGGQLPAGLLSRLTGELGGQADGPGEAIGGSHHHGAGPSVADQGIAQLGQASSEWGLGPVHGVQAGPERRGGHRYRGGQPPPGDWAPAGGRGDTQHPDRPDGWGTATGKADGHAPPAPCHQGPGQEPGRRRRRRRVRGTTPERLRRRRRNKAAANKAAANKAAANRAAAKKAAANKAAAKKAAAKKPKTTKAAAKKPKTKKAAAKKTPTKKTRIKKARAKKARATGVH